MRILLLGGTGEASDLAKALAARRADAIFSYAGRTDNPRAQPLPVRTGGFGGAGGLEAYLRAERITHVVDATHPFAAAMSRNAVLACAAAGVRLIGLERPGWEPEPQERWRDVADAAAACAALPDAPARVFLAIGRQRLGAFAGKPQHVYLLRVVDPGAGDIPLPDRAFAPFDPPFTVAGETALMQQHAITHLVAKNSGGAAGYAKLAAARALGVSVILIARPEVKGRHTVASVDAVLDWLDHGADRGV